MLVDNNVRNNPRQALYAYNHSNAYADQVLTWAATYQDQTATSQRRGSHPPPRPAPRSATRSHNSAPPTAGAARAPAASTAPVLSRPPTPPPTSSYRAPPKQQFDTGPPVPTGQQLQPGDLVFFGTDTAHIDHVGILINSDQMIDAPHTGALVRVEPYHWNDYLAATRPAS